VINFLRVVWQTWRGRGVFKVLELLENKPL
jgi:hypothetical protein